MKILFFCMVVVAVMGGIFAVSRMTAPQENPPTTNIASRFTTDLPPSPPLPPRSDLPLNRASLRTTKKIFGTFVTPKNSPVSPERFRGYHTAVDFETFANEQTDDVSVQAICDGPILQKRLVSGYGGLIVQKCTLQKQTVTVVYGHVRLSSISKKVGDEVFYGETFGVLGTGYSDETDGERKHLHLGIHKGTTINIGGYVSDKSSLSEWVDPKEVLGL